MSKRSSRSADSFGSFKKYDYSDQNIIGDPAERGQVNFEPKIRFADYEEILHMTYSSVFRYIEMLRSKYDNLTLTFIKKPSLNHLFEKALKPESTQQLLALVISIHHHIRESETLNFNTAQKKRERFRAGLDQKRRAA